MRNSITYVSDNLYFLSHIKEILDERYKAGFPAIKEIIQNANDGRATRLDFGVIRGLQSRVAHPLLKGSALFFLNNGSFSHDDEKAIIRIGVDANAGDKSKIGKFGLGQKSIFHFCEAFFYMARSKDVPEGCGSLIDPWAEGDIDPDRPEWTQLSEDDFQSIETYFLQHDLIKTQNQYFLLWVPLRQPASDNRYIIENYQDADTIQSLFPEDMAVQIGQLLPSLRHLIEVHYWVQKTDQTLEKKFGVRITGISNQQLERCRYPQSEEESEEENSRNESHAEYDLKGSVLIDPIHKQLQFAGKERLVAPQFFSSLLESCHPFTPDLLGELQRSPHWTKRITINRRVEKNSVPDKAIPHCAAIFSRKKAVDDRRSKLTVQWAVFLPLSGQEQDQSDQEEFQEYKCTGDFDYTLLLHGYFFLDSGRRYIHSLKSIIANTIHPEVPKSTDMMNCQWNRLLATYGTLRLILPALNQFVVTYQLSNDEVLNLCKSLSQSTCCRGGSQQHVCAEYQWIYKLHPDQNEWILLDTNVRVLPLPLRELDWSAFPILRQISEQSYLTYVRYPNLRIKRPHDAWTETEVSDLIESLDPSVVLTNQQYLSYLLELLEISTVVDHILVQDKLENLVREGLQKIDIQHLEELGLLADLKKLIGLVSSKRRFKLEIRANDKAIKNILPELYKLSLGKLLVCTHIEPSDSPSGDHLDDPSASLLLTYLASLLQDSKESYQQVADSLIEQVLTPELAPRFLASKADLQIILGYNCKLKKNQSYSYKQLTQLYQQSSLYNTVGRLAPPDNLGKALQEAIFDRQIVLISFHKAKLLTKTPTLGAISKLDKDACRRLIENCPVLSNSLQRIHLIKELSLVGMTRELRYLLHGNRLKYNDASTKLFIVPSHGEETSEDNRVWEKTGRQILEKSSESWRLIDQELANQVLPNLWSTLGIVSLKADEVIDLIERDFKQQGANCFDTTELTDIECNSMLSQLYFSNKQALWKGLRLHKTESNQRVTIIENQTYLKISSEPSFTILKNLTTLVTLIQLNPDQRVQRAQVNWIQHWTPQTAIYLMLSQPFPQQYCSQIMAALEESLPLWKTLSPQEVELLETRLRTTAWLSTKLGTQSIRPIDVVKLPENFAKYEADILTLKIGYSETALDSSIQMYNAAYQWLSQQFKFYSSLNILSLILEKV